MARRYWYGYISPGDIYDPASYRLLPNQSAPGHSPCLTGTTICAIYAYDGDINPIISANLTQYITNSTTANTPQPIGAGTTKYLFKKN